MNRLDAALTKLDKELKERIDGLSKHLESRTANFFDTLEKSVGALNERLDETNKQVGTLHARIEAVADTCATLIKFGERLEAVEKKSQSSGAN